MQKIIILSGNPGSGKTTIAKRLEEDGITRLSIDDFYQNSDRDSNINEWFRDEVFLDQSYKTFKTEILHQIENGSDIIIETSGVGKRWMEMFAELKKEHPKNLITIYLQIPKEESLKRVADRNQTDHPIKMDEERVNIFFEKSESILHDYDHVIDANRSIDQIYEEIKSLIEE